MSTGTCRSDGLTWQGCELQFLPERALWLEQQGLLLIADVHLGKAEHLQRHGIALPSDGDASNLERIEQLVLRHQPRELLILGDLIHHPRSVAPELHQRVEQLVERLPCSVSWVEGNHDRGSHLGPLLGQPSQQRQGLWLSHEPEPPPHGLLNVCGHLHPVSILRQASDKLRLACFSYAKSIPRLVLPAFGCLTGGHPAERTSEQWVVVDGTVLALPKSLRLPASGARRGQRRPAAAERS
ncbi:MAG: ligase-associated DNA damage response endonuclease PdeM [Synechococcus sp.]|nr:ligase-associated DNA damage response endonuclease PdeM [Synechococcus sp.]